MGGWTSALADVAKDAWTDSAAARTEANIVFKKAFRPMENYFNSTPVGQDLGTDIKEYFRQSKRNLSDLLIQEKAKPLHLQTPADELHSQATRLASEQVFGPNHANITGYIKAAKLNHGPQYAITLQDHVAMLLKDTVSVDELSAKQKVAKYRFDAKLGGKKYSQADVTGKKTVSLSKLNFLNDPEIDDPSGHNIDAVYHRPGALENTVHSFIHVVAAPFIVMPHLGTLFNNIISGNLMDMSKALTEIIPGTSSYDKWKQTLSHTGIFADTMLRSYKDLQNYRWGIVIPGTQQDVGYWLNKAVHQPGFNALRDWQLCATGTLAKLSAERYAKDWIASGSKKAEVELRDTMGLNLREIKVQNGQLNPDQIEKAIYNYVDKKIFLDNSLRRSYYSGANPIMRTALMYHGYVAAQGQFLRKEFLKAFQTGSVNINPFNKGPEIRPDIARLAQFMVVAGVVFPVVGEGIKQLERFGRGQKSDLGEDIDQFREGGWDSAWAMADAYAHMAGFGIGASYAQAASRNELANAMAGPAANMVYKAAQDVVIPLNKIKKGKKPNWKPLGRDVLEDTLPDNLGKIAAHKLLPTKQEEEAEHPKFKKNLKGLKMSKLKKLGE